jgi:hypothetical protein
MRGADGEQAVQAATARPSTRATSGMSRRLDALVPAMLIPFGRAESYV